MIDYILEIIYLIAAIAFIMGLKLQSSPDSAKKGNLVASFGMGLAIVATILLTGIDSESKLINYIFVFTGIALGGIVGSYLARTVQMTAMPEMVSLFNGFGGAASFAIAVGEFFSTDATTLQITSHISLVMGIIIGGVTFSGSLVAYRKLQGKQKDKIIPGQQFINLAILIAMIALGVLMYTSGLDPLYLYLICLLTIVYGVLFVLPIGGADMPVVISLLNSFSGIAGIFTGLLFNNMAMITGGILVGASGIILTVLMCKAMNRSLMNVIIGAFSANKASADAGDANKSHKEVNVTDAAIMCYYSSKVMIVPGYGMAVAQAQHIVHEVDKLLEANGVEVKYAIHPVAGRMPGHMNVLLAEADVPYPKLLELEDANNEFKTADIVLIIGANDVVNPAANDDPSSPIYGMPVLNVGEAKNVIIFKRSMNPGYAGIENPLFFKDNSRMLFGDAKKMLEALATEIKNQ